MALFQNDFAVGKKPTPIGDDDCPVVVRLPITLTQASLNDILHIGYLPADHLPVDFALDADDLDSNGAPAIVLSIGILNAALSDIDTTAPSGGAAWATGLTTAQNGGYVRMTTNVALRATPVSNADRPIGIKVTTAAATFQAGSLYLVLTYRPTHFNI